jgi:hypothetical protein
LSITTDPFACSFTSTQCLDYSSFITGLCEG